MEGGCGSCTVLVNNIPAAACKIPVGLVKDMDIVTLELFEKSELYSVIMEGFNKAGIKLCGYCTAGKVFSAYQLLKITKKLEREEITDYVKALSPCCTDLETLVNGIIYAIQVSNRKLKRS